MQFQLRMYRVKPGEMDDWISEWREFVLPLRCAQGFAVVGPWVRRAEDLFVWLVGHEDLAAANDAYYASPERRSMDPDPARHLRQTETWIVEPLEGTRQVEHDAEADEQQAE
jgi:ribosomal protein L11 methylase PrmA